MNLFRALVLFATIALSQPAAAQNYTELVRELDLSNSAQTVKAGPTPLLWYSCVNLNAAAAYLQIYDTSGAVVVGTTTPRLIAPLQAASSTGIVIPQMTIYAASSLKAAVTTTATGSTAPTLAITCDFATR